MIILIFIILVVYVYLTLALFYRLVYKGRQIKILKTSGPNSAPFFFRPQKPVSWFDLFGLINTFTKISNSTKTLAIIDKREVEASFKPDNPNFFNSDHTDFKAIGIKKDEFWFDFMADTGDGFDSTTTVFYALTRDKLVIKGKKLDRGNLLVVGGDLVYPEGSEESYSDRFKAPIRVVFPAGSSEESTYLIATPGNHDWYDGLSSFLRMICQQKKIGNYNTVQNRSYFAYSIYDNVHMIGLDNQLMGDIDIPQVNYFIDFASKLTITNDKKHSFILVVAEPYWYGYDFKDRFKRRQRMDSMEYIINTIKRTIPNSSNLDFKVVMTGDIHHYARYENSTGTTLITSGGGGAFKHMTSKLKSRISIPNLNDRTLPIASDAYFLKQKYFDDCQSNWHAAKNLLFPILNPRFTGLVFTLFTFVSLVLCSFTTNLNEISWWQRILLSATIPLFFGLILQSVEPPERSTRAAITFSVSVLCLGLFTFYINWSLVKHSFTTNLFNEVMTYLNNYSWMQTTDFISILNFIYICSIIALSNTLIFGIYLYIQYQLFGRNLTEASSSNVIEGYNHFIRCKITREYLEFYVIGLKKAYPWTKYVNNKSPNGDPNATDTSVSYETFLKDVFKKEFDPTDFEILDNFKVKL